MIKDMFAVYVNIRTVGRDFLFTFHISVNGSVRKPN